MASRGTRRQFALAAGEMAGVAFGPSDRPLDVLFLHANGFNAGTYGSILAPLGADLHVLAVDMRGHGRSTLPTHAEAHRWQVYADDLLALLKLTGMPRVLAGHSMGGATALLAAPQLPAATRLVLFDPVMAPASVYRGIDVCRMDYAHPMAQGALRRKNTFDSRDAAFDAYRGRGAFTTWPAASLLDYLEDGLRELPHASHPQGGFRLSCAPEWEAANFAAAMISNPYEGIRNSVCGIRVFKSAIGSVCSLTEADLDDAARLRIRIETVPGSTHFLPMEQWDLVREALRLAVEGDAE